MIMNNFNVSEWFTTRPKPFNIEGIEFELMGLTQDLIAEVKEFSTYNEMLEFAADKGLSSNGKRVADNEELAAMVADLWKDEGMVVDSDPCARLRVGEFVCGLSGLDTFIAEQMVKEGEAADLAAEEKAEAERIEELKEQGFINGDSETPDINIYQLNEDVVAAA